MDATLRLASNTTMQGLTYAQLAPLTPSTVLPSPLDQFKQWFSTILNPPDGTPKVPNFEIMPVSLATATASGVPSVRIVLLKHVDDRGFVFFTNYNSRKSLELRENPRAALGFYWKEVERQVRVVGTVEKVSEEESREYFETRPLGSRVGAWASNQSEVIGEGELEERVEEVKRKFGIIGDEGDVPLPEFWGGWRVVPDEVEFWVSRPNRLHDRIRYTRRTDGSEGPEWVIERLAP